jgi:hypothetical protein
VSAGEGLADLSDGACPAARAGGGVCAGEELGAGVGRGDGEADVVKGGEVWEVIAHEGDLVGCVGLLGQEVADGLAFVGEGEQEGV